MKRFWLVLLSLGLIMAFSASAFAVDVKVSGEFYAAGLYLNKTSVNNGWGNEPNDSPSTAFFFQRLRVGTDVIVSPCLKLVTRFDALERIWGGERGFEYDSQSVQSRFENENIAFDLAYIDYTSPVGLFRVGYQLDYEWGTIFDNRTTGPTAGMITYIVPVGPVTIVAQYAKEVDNSNSAVTSSSATDLDYDSYRLGAIFNFKGDKANGEVGALLLYNRNAENKANTGGPYDVGYLQRVYKLAPYFKAHIGPIALQGEFEYTFGDAVRSETPDLFLVGGQPDMSVSAISVFLDATVNLGMVYFGGSFAYLSGDDPGTKDKVEGGAAVASAGLDWNPCLILFNTETTAYWAGNISGHTESSVDSEMSNAWFFQGRVGMKPTPQWDIMLSASYAVADKKPLNPVHPGTHTFANGTYGTEIDLTGNYKITNNLSYMLGVGYLFTGDYFKGIDLPGEDYKTQDDFMIINKLTLTF